MCSVLLPFTCRRNVGEPEPPGVTYTFTGVERLLVKWTDTSAWAAPGVGLLRTSTWRGPHATAVARNSAASNALIRIASVWVLCRGARGRAARPATASHAG